MPKSLEQKIRELEDTVELLEKRVAYLESLLDGKFNEFGEYEEI